MAARLSDAEWARLVSIAAALYPARVAARFQPAEVIAIE